MIQSVDRAARITKVLANGPRRLGVSEIADRLGLTRPTVHGLLQTLQAHGFVEQDRDSDKYQLGAGLLQLGNSYLDLNGTKWSSASPASRPRSSITPDTRSVRSVSWATPIGSCRAAQPNRSSRRSAKLLAASPESSARAGGL